MDPITISLLANAGSSAFSGILGLGQLIAGAAKRPERPTYQIPPEIRNMLALRQMNLAGRMAGASQAQANIQQGQGSAIGAYQGTLRNPNAILAGVSASQGQTNRAFNNLAAMEAQDYQRRLAGLESAQRTMAGYRDREFEINEMQPYMDEARTKAALIGAGLRNTSGALASFANAADERAYMAQMQQMYGAQQPQNEPVAPVGMLPNEVSMPATPPVNLPDVNFFGNQGMTQNAAPTIGALASNLAFNDWVRRATGKNSTEFSPVELNFLRRQYNGM